MDVLLIVGRIIKNNSISDQFLISVSIFSSVERHQCLSEPYLQSIEGTTKLLITEFTQFKKFTNNLNNLGNYFTDFPDTSLFTGETKYSFNPGLIDGTLVCGTC